MPGMFVVALRTFKAEPLLCLVYSLQAGRLDATMMSGKFNEEVARMSEIVDHIVPKPMLLFNESYSYAATNEREGSRNCETDRLQRCGRSA